MAENEADKIMRVVDFEPVEVLELDDAFLVDGPSGTKHITVENLYQNVAENAVGNVGDVVNKIISSAANIIIDGFSDTKDKVEALEEGLQNTNDTVKKMDKKLEAIESSTSSLDADLKEAKKGIDSLNKSKLETDLSINGLMTSLGGCSLEQEGTNFYIIGEQPDSDPETPPLKQKIGSGDGTGNGGVSSYNDLEDQPSINGVTIEGEKTSAEYLKPIEFGGMLSKQTYDGTKKVNVLFPNATILNEAVGNPVGEILSFMGIIAPPNYLICDGTQYNIADYPYLAQHFIDNFGSVNYFGGDGETTFAVPDLRGEFLRGSGDNSHINTLLNISEGSGDNVGKHQDATTIGYIGKEQTDYIDRWGGGANYQDFGKENMDAYTVDSSTRRWFLRNGGNTPANPPGIDYFTSRPTNTSVLYCIKYKPTYYVKIQGSGFTRTRILSNATSDVDRTIDLTSYEGYENFTIENFAISEATERYKTMKSSLGYYNNILDHYDASTGILYLNKSSTWADNWTFYILYSIDLIT